MDGKDHLSWFTLVRGSQGFTDSPEGCALLTAQALGVDLQQDVEAAAGPFGDLWSDQALPVSGAARSTVDKRCNEGQFHGAARHG